MKLVMSTRRFMGRSPIAVSRRCSHCGGEVACNAAYSGAVGAVRSKVYLDDGIIEPGPVRVARAHGRIVGQLDDSLVIVRDLQLELRYQHPPAFAAADLADAERHVFAWNEGARRHKNALHSRSRIRRAADD